MKKKAKNQNPLYVVKKDHVEPVNNIFELVMKKLHLEPIWEILMNILKMLLDTVRSYEGVKMASEYLDLSVKRFQLFMKYSIV